MTNDSFPGSSWPRQSGDQGHRLVPGESRIGWVSAGAVTDPYPDESIDPKPAMTAGSQMKQ